MSAPRISVVISTLGMYESLGRVLDHYERQDAPRGSFEVIVALDLADPEPERVESMLRDRPYPARIVRGGRPGLSANRNAGAAGAAADVVLFTDNDTLPHPDLVRGHLEWHSRHPEPEVSVVGHVRWSPEVRVSAFMKWLDRGVQFDFPFIEGTDAGWGRYYGANVSSKRELIERAGGFDEQRLPYGYEDLEFAYRADRVGMRLLYNRAAVVDHLREMTLDFWRKRVQRIAVAERQFVALHPDIPPYFHRLFSEALARPTARGRGRHLARFVPPDLPLLGPWVWTSTDLYFRQQLAPHFLEAWNRADPAGVPSAGPDLGERALG